MMRTIKKLAVLFIDDGDDNRELARTRLGKVFQCLSIAESLDQGLAALGAFPQDGCVVTDLKMPPHDAAGFEIIEAAAIRGITRLVLYTTQPEESFRDFLRQYPGLVVIDKDMEMVRAKLLAWQEDLNK
jgi:CheY-like chemotaxis protein